MDAREETAVILIRNVLWLSKQKLPAARYAANGRIMYSGRTIQHVFNRMNAGKLDTLHTAELGDEIIESPSRVEPAGREEAA